MSPREIGICAIVFFCLVVGLLALAAWWVAGDVRKKIDEDRRR